MKKIYIFFGVPGSGKSYLGKRFAEINNYYFYEADADYTDQIRRFAEEDPMKAKSEFYNTVCNKIKKYLTIDKNIVVASAFGKNKFRHMIQDMIDTETKIKWILVQPNSDIHIDMITSREVTEDGDLDKDALKQHIKEKLESFEKPDFKVIEIFNNYDKNTLEKLNNIK